MIQPNELRIGNYVQTPDGIKQVTGFIAGKHITVLYFNRNDNDHCALHMAKPIPLTIEWLERWGLEVGPWFNVSLGIGIDPEYVRFLSLCQMSSADDFSYTVMMIAEPRTGGSYDGVSDFRKIEKGIDVGQIHFVHQLQNLYFALSGEELIIKDLQP